MADKRARGNNQKKDASRGGRSQASRKAPSRGPRQGSEPSRRGGVPRERAAVPAGDFIEGRRAAAEALRTGFPVKRALVADGQGSDAALARLTTSIVRTFPSRRCLERSSMPSLAMGRIRASRSRLGLSRMPASRTSSLVRVRAQPSYSCLTT